ncbi:MAG: hypothetical protein R2713_03375 [Ilumatobacteraceae bacterium]
MSSTTIDTAITSGRSMRTMRCDTASPPTTAEAPRMSRMLPMLLPTTLPSATSVSPDSAADALTASSVRWCRTPRP